MVYSTVKGVRRRREALVKVKGLSPLPPHTTMTTVVARETFCFEVVRYFSLFLTPSLQPKFLFCSFSSSYVLLYPQTTIKQKTSRDKIAQLLHEPMRGEKKGRIPYQNHDIQPIIRSSSPATYILALLLRKM